MSVLRKNIDANPYTGHRNVKGKHIKVNENAKWLDSYFNGDPNYTQVVGITRGKIYEVVSIEGHGDCEDVTIIDDNGNEHTLADFFFEEI